MSTQGSVEVDFGSGGAFEASVDVSGQTGLTTAGLVDAWLTMKATTDHSIDEHRIEDIEIRAGNVATGSFTVYARSPRGFKLFGKWNVAWVWNE